MTQQKYSLIISNNNDPPFQITINLDNKDYIFRISYNIYAQRLYFTILDLEQNIIKTAPLVSSTITRNINLVYNLFHQNELLYRKDLNLIIIT